jgi:hypothetical protein
MLIKNAPISGYYKGHYLRSHAEFIYALYLDKVEKVNFVAGKIALHSRINNKKKIPDFIYIDNSVDRHPHLVEIKSSIAEAEKLAFEYENNFYIGLEQFIHKIIAMTPSIKRKFIAQIKNEIGENEFIRLDKVYRDQKDRTYTGWQGALNPNFGIKTSDEKKAKTKATKILNNTYDISGNKNPNFGNHHSDKAKIKIGAKWSDPKKKLAMKKKGMLTHFSNIADMNKPSLKDYLVNILINKNIIVKPDFLNRAYIVKEEKIIELFDSVDNFFKEVKL